MTPSRTFLPCPGCGRTLGLPPEALGKPLNCPHCRAAFHVPRGPDGFPGTQLDVRWKVNIGFNILLIF